MVFHTCTALNDGRSLSTDDDSIVVSGAFTTSCRLNLEAQKVKIFKVDILSHKCNGNQFSPSKSVGTCSAQQNQMTEKLLIEPDEIVSKN